MGIIEKIRLCSLKLFSAIWNNTPRRCIAIVLLLIVADTAHRAILAQRHRAFGAFYMARGHWMLAETHLKESLNYAESASTLSAIGSLYLQRFVEKGYRSYLHQAYGFYKEAVMLKPSVSAHWRAMEKAHTLIHDDH